MIPNKYTSTIYFSEILQHDQRYTQKSQELTALLTKHAIPYHFLRNTKDIWCRDYMPIQIDENKWVQFRYQPGYLNSNPELQTDPTSIHKQLSIAPILSDIKLDGGNVICWTDKVIMTDRIMDENPQYGRSQLVNELEELLQAEVILIPQIKSDMTGHVDGMLRFVDSHLLIGNERTSEYKYWSKAIKGILRDHQLDYIDIPFMNVKITSHPDHAIGCYVNYLEIQNLIILPIFEMPDNHDQVVYDIFRQVYPDRQIETININDIGIYGGLLNCISWQSK